MATETRLSDQHDSVNGDPALKDIQRSRLHLDTHMPYKYSLPEVTYLGPTQQPDKVRRANKSRH